MSAFTSLASTIRLALIALAAVAAGCSAPEDGPAQGGDAPRELAWRDLVPPEEAEQLRQLREGRAPAGSTSGFSTRKEEQIGSFNAVESLDGELVRMPGFILPLDYAERGSAREFLFLPYHGACVHYPPPPPNQIVYLRSETPIRFDELWDPVWIEGRLEIQRTDTDLAAAAYAMTALSVEPYEP